MRFSLSYRPIHGGLLKRTMNSWDKEFAAYEPSFSL